MPGTSSSTESREIRVFLSSTFRDFMQERDLLVKQVFPSLRRRAQERGVEIVDVDLRWGITEEESQQGKVIGICLAEIERCRPYFIGMLGERYGWIPQRDDYPADLLEQETLHWIREHQGGASVTELEILHGVLNDPQMAGRAYFYFRDPAWSRAQREPGFVCDTPEEAQKLAALKDRIRANDFPVAENLANPQAIADQIEADLSALIEELYPELDQSDALEREARKQAGYRRSRLGVYLDGEGNIQQLEEWIQAGESKVLITGESGCGKSALVANWMAEHERAHPEDIVFAHHLGCSNDANAIRPLLGRMLETASKQLMDAGLITQRIEVPEDWWELTAIVAETLQDLGRWCSNTNRRWIWVLDGLDRLLLEDQEALPWLPLAIPESVSVVISALHCQATRILQERNYRVLQIGPLKRKEQEQLIKQYLKRYTKQLDSGLRKRILTHRQACSPLFLRVLLEEIRQCGRHETLPQQLESYLAAETVTELYELVLERLETDGNGAALEAALTALWGSRAGLAESELLAIAQLSPLEWAPIDLALHEALGRCGNRQVLGHEYLRQAVECRYLTTHEEKRNTHLRIAEWFAATDECDARRAEELPWQLLRAGDIFALKSFLLSPKEIALFFRFRSTTEAWSYWKEVEQYTDQRMDELYEEKWRIWNPSIKPLSDIAASLRDLLSHAGRHGDFSVEVTEFCVSRSREGGKAGHELIDSLFELIELHRIRGEYQKGILLCREALRMLDAMPSITSSLHSKCWMLYAELCTSLSKYDDAIKALDTARKTAAGPDRSFCKLSEGWIRFATGDFCSAEALVSESLLELQRDEGENSSRTLQAMNNLGIVLLNQSRLREAQHYTFKAWRLEQSNLGKTHWIVGLYGLNYGWTVAANGDPGRALEIYKDALSVAEHALGGDHPMSHLVNCSIAWVLYTKDEQETALQTIIRATTRMEALMGSEHRDLAIFFDCFGWLCLGSSHFEKAVENFQKSAVLAQGSNQVEHPDAISPWCGLALSGVMTNNPTLSKAASKRAVQIARKSFHYDHLDSALALLTNAVTEFALGNIDSALKYAQEGASMQERLLGENHWDTRHSKSSIQRIKDGKSPHIAYSARRFSGGSFL